MAKSKLAHTIVLDSGPIIKNEPAVSSLLACSEALVTTPTVIAEIRDTATRSRVETLLKPFLTLRQPKPSSLQFVAQFARRTGDYASLSKTDLEIIALTYEIECERLGGDWRLRKTPGQKHQNGKPSPKNEESNPPPRQETNEPIEQPSTEKLAPITDTGVYEEQTEQRNPQDLAEQVADLSLSSSEQRRPESKGELTQNAATGEEPASEEPKISSSAPTKEEISPEDEPSDDSDSEGWITPANFKKHQAKQNKDTPTKEVPQKRMDAAVITTDFAMQNVILQMNLHLISANLQRIHQIKNFVLRCYACFGNTKDMSKQFCPRCGQPALTKVACTTNSNGEFQLHLKKGYQVNKRGDRYSIPKAVAGSAHGRVTGGGQGSWGNDLLLAEDQKEYVRAIQVEKRQKQRDLMDDDFLPSILSGQRNTTAGRPKVGAGRNVNSRKRH